MESESGTGGIVHGLLVELDFPISSTRDSHAHLQSLFEGASEPAAQLLVGERKAPGRQGFAMNQLVVRAFSDVIVSFHLALHGFVNSAYNEVRIAYEACDLIKLFAKSDSEAKLWIESDRPWSDFSPSVVRRKLGEEGVDEIYSHLCGMAHPRFEGADLTGYMFERETGERVSHFSMGPTPLVDERPFVAHAMSFIGMTLGRVVAHIGYLVEVAGVDEGECRKMFQAHLPALREFLRATTELAATSGQPEAVEFMEEALKNFPSPGRH